jgi:pimeloyl-ACP methyl ester carboxylesterase
MLLSFNDPKALAAVARSFPAFAVPEEKLRANKVPTLALIGEIDPLKAGVDRLDGVMANLKIVVIPGANHMTAFTHPDFVSNLKTFLAEHPAEVGKAVSAGAK